MEMEIKQGLLVLQRIFKGVIINGRLYNDVKGEIINLGTDEQTTVKEVAEYIVERTASRSKIIYTPREKVFGDYDEIQVRYANTKKAKDLIDFQINISTYEIIDSMIESYSNINSKYYVIK